MHANSHTHLDAFPDVVLGLGYVCQLNAAFLCVGVCVCVFKPFHTTLTEL